MRIKCIGFENDEANEMTGTNNGVIARVKKLQSSVQGIHFFVHR